GVGAPARREIDDPRVGRVQPRDRARVGLDVGQLVGPDATQAAHAVGVAATLELGQAGELVWPGREDDLAAALMLDVVRLAILVQLARALNTQTRLQRARLVVDASVYHPRAVAALVGGQLVLALEHAHRRLRMAPDQLTRNGETHDTAT